MAFRFRTTDGREYISHRPQLMGRRAMAVSGHPLASQAAFRVLERGGNAVDAGVAAGLCLSVLQSDFISFLGVAPIMIYLARERRVLTLSGVGPWPRAASIEWFRRHCGGEIPPGVRRAVVPAAPDAWLTALERYGTMGFAEVAEGAIELAEGGFAMYPFMHDHISASLESYRRWRDSWPVYFPDGELVPVGRTVVHKDLAETFRRMARAEEKAAGRGRAAGVRAARDEVYAGETARRIVDYVQREGGLLEMADLADFSVEEEPPVSTSFLGLEVMTCGPWCQGPAMLEAMNILGRFDLAAMGHNTPAYLHTLFSALDLAFADREAFIGDPRFVDVPLGGLLSEAHAAAQAGRIDPGRAFGAMPAPGDPWTHQGGAPAGLPPPAPVPGGAEGGDLQQDTSYCTVVDAEGNAFSATPSDPAADMPIVPGVGATVSSRGSQIWLEEGHPSALAPGKRPRLTPMPVIALREGAFAMTMGTPGGDTQAQTMTQVLLNHALFGMQPQMAVEAARGATYNFPGSFWPHVYAPGRAMVEERLGREAGGPLREMGYALGTWKDYDWPAGSVCCIVRDPETGYLLAGADPRRASTAVGW